MQPTPPSPAESRPDSGDALPPAHDRLAPRAEPHNLTWAFIGPDGLRAGWSVGLFLVLTLIFGIPVFLLLPSTTANPDVLSPVQAIHDELLQLLPMLAAFAVMKLIEGRRWATYYLASPKRAANFVWGLGAGFVTLSILIAGLYSGHWIRLSTAGLSWASAAESALLWAIAFLMVAVFEEGAFRCYLLFTFTRSFGQSPWGFWIAAVLTSALFGVIHLGNNGEGQIGIVSAAAIGFVFCVSVRLTGSAWWAIGFHASWDWAQTFFYGSADSGLIPEGHLLNASPAGNPLWSGGLTGPEGSLLVYPLLLLILIALVAVYGRRSNSRAALPVPDQAKPVTDQALG